MTAEAAGFDELLREWRGLRSGDRRAILRRLPPVRRRQFERALAANPADDEQALLYRAYSPWLGRLIEACETGAEAAAMLKPSMRKALARAHEQAEEALEGRNERVSLFDLLRSTLLDWKERL